MNLFSQFSKCLDTCLSDVHSASRMIQHILNTVYEIAQLCSSDTTKTKQPWDPTFQVFHSFVPASTRDECSRLAVSSRSSCYIPAVMRTSGITGTERHPAFLPALDFRWDFCIDIWIACTWNHDYITQGTIQQDWDLKSKVRMTWICNLKNQQSIHSHGRPHPTIHIEITPAMNVPLNSQDLHTATSGTYNIREIYIQKLEPWMGLEFQPYAHFSHCPAFTPAWDA